MTLLRIDSSARRKNSKTRMLTDFFMNELNKKNEQTVISRDVGINPPNFPTDDFIKANYTPETVRTSKMKEILEPSDILIQELIDADKIIIASPMYNFSISATLKAYIDNIVRVGQTFAIDKNGAMQGLLGGKKVVVITSRGAMSYKLGGALQPFDFQTSYLTKLFNFLGITDIIFVNTEGQDFGEEPLKTSNLEQSKQELSELAKTW